LFEQNLHYLTTSEKRKTKVGERKENSEIDEKIFI